MSINFLFILSFLLIESSQSLDEDYFKVPVKPEHYNITILVLFNESTFEGFVDILTECKEETNSIKLHAQEMVIDKDKITVKEVEASIPVPLSGVEIDEKNQTVVMSLGENLKKDVKYVIHIEYKANLTQSPYGFYKNWYMNADHTYGTLANTHFEPTWARKAFPCFDLPHMKATFQLTMGHDEKLFALNNMPLLSSEPVEGREGYVWEHFDKTLTMSTYLVAFAILDHGMKNITSGKITFWYPPLSNIPHEYALKKSVEMLSYLEDYFEMKYELPKLDFLVVNSYPTFAGAEENWGLIIAEETAVHSKKAVLGIIAHELVHMWIGNLMTMKCFGELWLKEGLTTYYTNILKDEFYEEQIGDSVITDDFITLMAQFSTTALSLEYCPDDKDVLMDMYGQNTYHRGALFTRMFQKFLGINDLKKTMQVLLKKFTYKNYDEDDLWAALKETSKSENFPEQADIHEVFSSWTKQVGYPLVEVNRNYDTGSAKLQQRRFYSRDEDSCWWIPVSYTTKSEKNHDHTAAKTWLKCPKEPLVISDLKPSEWILINLQSAGMFIVKYDDTNWNLITDTLTNDEIFEVIPFWDRFKLVLDASYLSHFGLLSHESVLTTLLFLKHETNAEVWRAALTYLSKLNWLSNDIIELKNEYMRILVQRHFSTKIFDFECLSKKEQNFNELIIKTACESGVQVCTEEVFRLFDEFKTSFPNVTLHEDLRAMVFCLAVKYGPEENTKFILNLLMSVDLGMDLLPDLQASFLCLKNEPRMGKTTGSIFRNDTDQIFKLLKAESLAIDPVDSIIQELENILQDRYATAVFVDSILLLSSQIHEPKILNRLKGLFEEEKFRVFKQKTDMIVERINSNVEWKTNYSEEIKMALLKILRSKNQTEETTTTRVPGKTDKPVRKPPSSCELFDANYYFTALCFVIVIFFE